MYHHVKKLMFTVRVDEPDPRFGNMLLEQFGGANGELAADLALIGAAQRVEHYEMSAYTTAKNLAQQLRHSAIVALLSKSLAEEENSDQLLNQVARSLMSVAKMPAVIEQSE
jgi:Mn-containing catalase